MNRDLQVTSSPLSPEITWSLMHPTPLDASYFQSVLDAAAGRMVHSFEICGECCTLLSGLDALVDYAEYPQAAGAVDTAAVQRNRVELRKILRLSHAAGKEVLLWHREVVLPPDLAATIPGLLDADGEFDFFGDAFARLIRYKLASALEACPELDGLVLTLTEAQFSVVHPSNAAKYPPVEVVKHVARFFADEMARLGKRFVLRSFGSTPEDYETLLAGAELAARSEPLEIQTKATPYDFIPFFRKNPFLHPTPGCTLSVEFDGLGEFLGAGYFPASEITDLLERVRQARAAGAERYVIRIDRTGQDLMRSSYAFKLDVFETAVRKGPDAGAEAFARWIQATAPGAERTLQELLRTGDEALRAMLFVGGNVICHTNPVAPRLKWIKAGGFFGVLHGGESLSNLREIWSIQTDRPALFSREIMAEKDRAVQLATHGLSLLKALGPALPPPLHARLNEEWHNLHTTARGLREFTRFSLGVLEALETGEDRSAALRDLLVSFCRTHGLETPQEVSPDSDAIELDLWLTTVRPVQEAWIKPLAQIMAQLLAEFPIELAMRRKLAAVPDTYDFLVPGGVADDWRVGRAMHASHAAVVDGRLVRIIGNRLFPNGYVDLHLRVPRSGGRLVLQVAGSAIPRVSIDGANIGLRRTSQDTYEAHLAPRSTGEAVVVRVSRSGQGELLLVATSVLA